MVKAEKNDPIVKKIAQNSQNNSFGDFFLWYVLPVLLWLHPVSYLLSWLIDFEIGFLVSFLTGLWGTYYVYNDVVFEFCKNLYSTKFSLEDFFKLLTVRQRCDTLLRSKKVFQSHFGSIFSRPKWYELSGPQSKLSLANQDPYCLARGGKILDLSTKTEGSSTRYNFKCLIKLGESPPVMCEIDSDSHISLISEEYFDNVLSKNTVTFLEEPPPIFDGMGSHLKSKYPPVSLQFQIGGLTLSSRFAVSSELTSSPILIGSDVMVKYKLSIVPCKDGGWMVQIGAEPQGTVPCYVTSKIIQCICTSCKKFTINKLQMSDLHNDFELEEMLEPGYPVANKTLEKEKELKFIQDHPNIPDKNKKELLKCLHKIPHLYSGREYSEKAFPAEVFEHDVEFLENMPTEMNMRPFPVSGIRLQQLKETINDMVRDGILKPGDSPYVSPCFYVLKKPTEGKTASKGRLCFDYRRLNSMIKPMHFPISNVKNFFQEASRFKLFSVLDIQNAFLSISLTERAKKRCAVITPFGVYLPQRTPFGLKTSPSAFCQAIDKVLGDLPFCQVYVDDVLIGAEDDEEMSKNLQIVFKRLAQFNLKIQIPKAQLYVPEMKILGVVFSRNGKKIDPEKVKSISEFPPITSLKETQCFLGMLAYVSSFIPHFSTSMFPVFNLLKDQKTKKWEMTKEAEEAIEKIKEFLKQETMLYNPDFSKPLYLATDASQVGVGGFLYQLEVFEKTEEGKQKCLDKFGFLPENTLAHNMIPGVSPGKQTPIVTEFLKNEADLKCFDIENCLNISETMTEKLKRLNDKIVVVRPISWYSKLFSQNQTLKYCAMEKEFLGIMLSVLNFRDYLEASPITFILTDAQSVLWAMRHRTECVKLSRYLLKLFELNINFVCCHLAGSKNQIADFLSRIYSVDELANMKTKNVDGLHYKAAQHVTPSFPPMAVLTKDDILGAFDNNTVEPCNNPENCHLNVNSQFFRGLGPFDYKPTCLQAIKKVQINKTMETFTFTPTSLEQKMSLQSISHHQRLSPETKKIIDLLEGGSLKTDITYFLQKGILYKKFKKQISPDNIILPRSLVPFALALYHFQTHAGSKKMYSTMRIKYYWQNMQKDITEFSNGCILCAIMKNTNQGQNEIGEPRKILFPKFAWQIDICSGFPPVRGISSFLNCVDLFSGFTLPLPLKNETSEAIATAVEQNIIKIFGPPKEISSDNANNLQGPALTKLYKFYGITHKKTTPYAPQSHGLVEVQNRYVTQLVRLFSEQFRCAWLDVLTLATIIINAVPRPVLQNTSPHYIMFGSEPFGTNPVKNNFFDISEHNKQSQNNKNFGRLVRDLILQHRENENRKASKSYKSFPEGTLVYVKDQSKVLKKKAKPIFLKGPFKIIKEYRCIVYALDVLGRVSKHSKNNIKRAGQRSAELFGALPDELKLIFGGPMNTELWDEMVKNNELPDYLKNIEQDLDLNRQTRGNISGDTHLLEQQDPDPSGTLDLGPGNVAEEDDDLEEILMDEKIKNLQTLHDLHLLTDDNLTLENVDKLLKQTVITEVPLTENELLRPQQNPILNPIVDRALVREGISQDNVLTGSRRVRFQL